MKKKIGFLIFSMLIIALQKYNYQHFKGFSLYSIEAPLPKNFQDPYIDLPEEALNQLKQPYHFFSLGNQAFAFESEDKKTIIKFLKTKRFELTFFQKLYHQWINSSHFEKVQKRVQNELVSYKLAHTYLKEASQILGIKLGPSENLPSLVLIDPYGLKKVVDLNKTCFVMQPKGLLFKEVIAKSPTLERKQALEQVVQLIEKRYQYDILDKDPRIHRNIGFLNNKPFFIDLGSFIHQKDLDEASKAAELAKILEYQTNFMKRTYGHSEE